MDTTLLDVDTTDRPLVDLTRALDAFCAGRAAGLLNVFVPHATAGLAVVEVGAGSEPDLLELLDRLLPATTATRTATGRPATGPTTSSLPC